MALTTVAYCRACAWRSSPVAITPTAAGRPCPNCKSGLSALHYDPAYTGTDPFGRPYVEATVAAGLLASAGISTVAPATAVAIPAVAAVP